MLKYLFKLNVVCSISAASYKIVIITKSNADRNVIKDLQNELKFQSD